jgi:hypothetical protein
MSYLKTMAVARQLDTAYWKLLRLVHIGKIPAPSKDTSGDLIWTEGDVERARAALAERRTRSREVPA